MSKVDVGRTPLSRAILQGTVSEREVARRTRRRLSVVEVVDGDSEGSNCVSVFRTRGGREEGWLVEQMRVRVAQSVAGQGGVRRRQVVVPMSRLEEVGGLGEAAAAAAEGTRGTGDHQKEQENDDPQNGEDHQARVLAPRADVPVVAGAVEEGILHVHMAIAVVGAVVLWTAEGAHFARVRGQIGRCVRVLVPARAGVRVSSPLVDALCRRGAVGHRQLSTARVDIRLQAHHSHVQFGAAREAARVELVYRHHHFGDEDGLQPLRLGGDLAADVHDALSLERVVPLLARPGFQGPLGEVGLGEIHHSHVHDGLVE